MSHIVDADVLVKTESSNGIALRSNDFFFREILTSDIKSTGVKEPGMQQIGKRWELGRSA